MKESIQKTAWRNIWLAQNAELIPSPLGGGEKWVTKARGDYIKSAELIDTLPDFILDLTHVSSIWEAGKPINLGWNANELKWYGWSHRAVFGFTVGSTCKFGDAHYVAKDPDDFLRRTVHFWKEEYHDKIVGKHALRNGVEGVEVTWRYSDKVPNKDLANTISGNFSPYPSKFGRGEWTAKTSADARQMAIDFAESVA